MLVEDDIIAIEPHAAIPMYVTPLHVAPQFEEPLVYVVVQPVLLGVLTHATTAYDDVGIIKIIPVKIAEIRIFSPCYLTLGKTSHYDQPKWVRENARIPGCLKNEKTPRKLDVWISFCDFILHQFGNEVKPNIILSRDTLY